MTTPATGRKLTTACNGVTQAFACPVFQNNGDLKVYLLNAATDANAAGTLLSEGADYVISGSGPLGTAQVTTVAVYPGGKYLRRFRTTSRAQLIEIVASEGVPAATQEAALDRGALIDEEQDDDLSRALTVPSGAVAPTLPAPADFAGKFFAGNVDGTALVASDGTGADAGLRTDLAAASGASLIAVQGHAPAIVRSLQQILDEGLSLRKDFGAFGDGSDQTAKVQEGLDAVIDTGGAELVAPPGEYRITSKLSFDISAIADRFASRLRLRGAGSAFTKFRFEGVADTLLELLGNPAVSETRLDLQGISLFGDNTIGSRGLHLNVAAYGALRDVTAEGFDQQLEFDNVEQIALYECIIRWGRKGIKTNVGASTAANSILLFNTVLGNHILNAIDADDLNVFTMIGGGILNNGALGGGATNFGCKLNNPGTALGTVKFGGVVFEGNGGQADLWINSTTVAAAIGVDSCAFSRASSLAYAANNIRVDGSQGTRLSLTGNAFRSFNDYVPNAARPYLAINNTAAIVKSDGSNLFGSATEAPSWYASRWPITVNSGIVHVHAGQIAQAFAWNPASLAAGATATTSFAMAGVEVGDSVIASFSTATGVQSLHAEVISTGNVGVRLTNDSGGTLDEDGIVLIRVFKL